MPIWFSKKAREERRARKAARLQPIAEELPKEEPPRRLKVGLALSGGGARGYAHLGAMRAFEEEGIEFDVVAGTSAGSIVGAMYCYGMSVADMIVAGTELDVKEIRDRSIIPTGSNPQNIERVVQRYIGDAQFSDLPKPFAAVAVDLRSGLEVVLREGSVAKAVSASCSVPLIFKPVPWGEMNLIDGGTKNVLPSDVVRDMGAERVVGIDINPGRGYGTDSLKMFDVLFATFRICTAANAKLGIRHSDIVIQPDTRKYKASSKEGFEEMIEEGYRAAKEAIPDIKELFYEKKNTGN